MNIQSVFTSPYIKNQPLRQKHYSQNISFKGLNYDVFQKSKPASDEELLKSLGVDNSIFESKTIQKLYSDKFYTPQRQNEDGYYVTTIIDAQTKEPVEAFLQKDYICYINDNSYEENWDMFVKKDDTYDYIGSRNFTIDKDKNVITPGNMKSGKNKKYLGIGFRLHQLAIERMQQEGLENVEITSIPKAFPFHYKSGFRATSEKENLSQEKFEERLKWLEQETNLQKETLIKCYHAQKRMFGGYSISEKGNENIKRILYSKGKIDSEKENLSMHLSKDSLKQWEERINLQPILPH